MRKICNKNVKIKGSVFFCLITAGWLLLAVMGGLIAAVFLIHRFPTFLSDRGENPFLAKAGKREIFTSMGYRYDKQFQLTLNRYRRFSTLYDAKASSPVPGLELTNVLGEGCNRMVPQGICIAGDYMLVTAYDNVKQTGKKFRRSVRKANNSVLYVISNQNPASRKLLTTIVLPDINHVGGIAFDGSNVWIAKSTTKMCSRISFDRIQQAVESGSESYALKEYDQNIPCGSVASFATFYDGRLWVGTYSNRISGTGMLRAFDIKKENTQEGAVYSLDKRHEIVIPGYANGVEFVQTGGKTFMAVTSSKGRYFKSNIYLYEVVEDPNTGKNLYYQYDAAEFPPMAEEMVSDGAYIYFLFESSATCYSASAYGKCIYPVDRICALSAQELFWQNRERCYRKATPKMQKNQLVCVYDVIYQERKYWRQYQGRALTA